VEVVHAGLAGRRAATAPVEPRAHAALHGLDHLLVLELDAVQARACPLVAARSVGHE
jgi:hypothetical protein